jgi:branched-chain amino acid aminotransferase
MSDAVHPPYLWYNGGIIPWGEATLHATSIIWSGVNTVFEGMRAYWNPGSETMHIFRLREHLERLRRSIRLIRMQMPYDVMALMEELPLLLQRNEIREDTYIRVVALPTERPMASWSDAEAINLMADTAPHASHLSEDRVRHMMVSSYARINDGVMSPQVKSIANYRNSEVAVQEARLAGYDGPIFLNRLGEVAEGAYSSLFIVRDGTLITPDLASDVLTSITRDAVIRIARADLRIPTVERRVTRTELYVADEAFLCGTAAEILPIGSIDRYTICDGTIVPITEKLRLAYRVVVRGESDVHPEWRTSAPMPTAMPAVVAP